MFCAPDVGIDVIIVKMEICTEGRSITREEFAMTGHHCPLRILIVFLSFFRPDRPSQSCSCVCNLFTRFSLSFAHLQTAAPMRFLSARTTSPSTGSPVSCRPRRATMQAATPRSSTQIAFSSGSSGAAPGGTRSASASAGPRLLSVCCPL